MRRSSQHGQAPPSDVDLTGLITRLAESCARLEPGMASEVKEVTETLDFLKF